MKVNLKDVGIWIQRHYQYLNKNRPTTVNVLKMNGTLNSYLREDNEQAEEMTFQLVKQLAKQEGITEKLKRRDQIAGSGALLAIALALIIRSVGVLLCMIGTPLTKKERLFCVLSYLPKATVQAAIGSVPLSLGLPCGQLVLSVAVLAIVITAPLGAWAIDLGAEKLLKDV